MFRQNHRRDQTSQIRSINGSFMMPTLVMNLLKNSRMKRTGPEAKKMTPIKPSNDCLELKVKTLEIRYYLLGRSPCYLVINCKYRSYSIVGWLRFLSVGLSSDP